MKREINELYYLYYVYKDKGNLVKTFHLRNKYSKDILVTTDKDRMRIFMDLLDLDSFLKELSLSKYCSMFNEYNSCVITYYR